MESRKSIKNLAGSIRSLLGLKTHLTSTWADSVCNIIKDLPCEKPFNSSQAQTLKIKASSYGNKDTDDVGTDVLKIQDDLADLNADLNKLNLLRRQALNDFLDLKGNIRVFCRIRPTIEGETFGTLAPVVAADSSNVVLRFSENKIKRYSFNKVFHPGSTQDEVFAEVEPVIKSALDGYNACIFAYGQTGTGKTFTMEGKPDSPGVVPLAIEALFNQAQDSSHSFVFTFSMLEIYMGNLRDLLVPQTAKSTDTVTQSLSIQKDPKGGVEIDNLVAIRVSDFNQAKRLYGIGSRFRSTASTNANVTSSRSHCLTRISMTCFDAPERRRETNKLWMVDLGGSERVLKTKAWGRRLDEGKAINLSLSALGDVISALQRRKSHVPYRNSKLTQVLTDSLGDDSKTLMIVHVSPKEEDLCETVCSLGFATRVRSIHLGHDESSDVKTKKEVAMAQLQQKLKQLEYESQDIKKDIKKLKERLIQFTGAGPSPDEHIEFEHIYDQLPRSKDREKCTMLDRTVSVPAQLPRFMRPTVCSKRKSGKDQTATLQAKKKDSLGVRRKKPSSLRAESVTFPLKANSEYGSECSVSRTSCLTDYETEYSNNTSECDIKMVIFPEQKRPHKVLGPSNPLLSHKSSKESENSEADKIHNWLHLRNTEPTSAFIHGTKRMDAIPPLHKNNEFTGELKHNENQNQGFTLKESNPDKLEKIAHKQLHGRSSSVKEVAIDETKYNLDNHMTWEHGTTLPPPSHHGKASVETRSLFECFGMEDNECYSIDNLHSGLLQKKDYASVEAEMIDERASNDVTESMLECSIIDENKKLQVGADNRSCSGVRNEVLITDRSEVIDQGDVAQTPILDENKMEEKEMTELCVSQDVEVLARSCLLKFKSRRALFANALSEERKCRHTNTGGILDVIGQKVQVICASTLLGLGLQNVGLGHDFFNALII